MKILFIYPVENRNQVPFQYGISMISAVLKQNDHETNLLIDTLDVKENDFIRNVKKSNPDLIAFTSTTNTHPIVKLHSSWIKEHLDLPILCGGIHATLSPEDVLDNNSIDMVCIGEGEYPVLELANSLEKNSQFDKINNIWVKKDGKIIRNEIRALIEDLDKLPFADRELYDYKKFIFRNGFSAELMAGRGCPYACSYCCNHALKKLYTNKGKYIRMRTVNNVLDEIRNLIQAFKIDNLWFYDDTFTLNQKWLEEFATKYRKEFDLPISCNGRIENLNCEVVKSLKKIGCSRIGLGIESGNEWLRESVLKRRMSNEQIIKGFEMLKKAGISTSTFFMVGIPFETPKMVEDSLELIEKIDVDAIQCTIFYPYANTEAYQICKKEGFLTPEHQFNYFNDSVLSMPTISREQIKQYSEKFRSISNDRYDKYIQNKFKLFYPMYRCSQMLIGKEKTYNYFKSFYDKFVHVLK